MLARYVFADLVRNPRRTLATMVGVALGVGLFCGVLFFVDGLSASMTQRAVAPLAIDMQRIVTERAGGSVRVTQTFEPRGLLAAGEKARVVLEIRNPGEIAANEVTIRSAPTPDLKFVDGSAVADEVSIVGFADNPFAHGSGRTGFNLGTVEPGTSRFLVYEVEARVDTDLSDETVLTTSSSRESLNPTRANEPPTVALNDLAEMISAINGVARANQLSFADLGSDTLSSGGVTAAGPAKIFGFDDAYASADSTIVVVEGNLTDSGAVLSAEAAESLHAGIGDIVAVLMPDNTTAEVEVTGIADLSRSRSLFSSRRGGDLETFIYTRNSVIVSAPFFADTVEPAFERAAANRGSRLKSPPVREIDITIDHDLLASDPRTAAEQTRRIGEAIAAVAVHQDYLLDNISNTLTVATADAAVAKRLFIFLGVPGGFLAAMLAAYSGTVLAEAQRREQATLRVRGANRRHLLRMLALRSGVLTAVGSVVGLVIGYWLAAAILGRESLDRSSTTSLVISGLLGSLGGFLATGTSLYITGRRSIDREINEDRARLAMRSPLWRRARLDVFGMLILVVGTTLAIGFNAFDGSSGSVYYGRGVELNLVLLILPITVWISGSLLGARLIGNLLDRSQPDSTASLGRPFPSLYRLSVGRRPWAIGNGAIIVSLIVALATSIGGFTASYDAAKIEDARYANGADIRITPSPTAQRPYTIDDTPLFQTNGIAAVTPVIYGLSNVILRSARTSDPANLAAVDPATLGEVSPLRDADFELGDAAAAFRLLDEDPLAVMLSADMAGFLKAKPGDNLNVLLARATQDQVEVELHIVGLYDRLPGFPDGADALMSIRQHILNVPGKAPDFFLALPISEDDATLEESVQSLLAGPGSINNLQIDTRSTTLASDQSSLAALNIAGLVDMDSGFALAMAVVTIAIFVFGLLLQRRREYITLRAQGLGPRTIRSLIVAEAGTVAIVGILIGVAVGAAMGFYFVSVLRPLFVLAPAYIVSGSGIFILVGLVIVATIVSSIAASRLVNTLDPTELLRDE